MSGITATLFGKFFIERDRQIIEGMEANKVRELLAFLLVNRREPQPREALAETMWGDLPPDRSKKYLRQALWKLKSSIESRSMQDVPMITVDADWIQVNPRADLWLDTEEFEKTYLLLKDRPANELKVEEFLCMQKAIELYKGSLLAGWYQEWCLFERERFQIIYLMLLNKLVQYCEINRLYDAGLYYGSKLLQYDRAYERAHRQLMRLYYIAGDRTQALRQYQRCVAALREELDVEPSERTTRLYEQIRADTMGSFFSASADPEAEHQEPVRIDLEKIQDRFTDVLPGIYPGSD